MMEGYYGRERHEVFDADGWYRTGDLVVVDADGFFYFKGRRGDMIKTSGANVSPREVEAAIHDLTGLAAHVIGIDGRRPRPGRRGGGPRAGRAASSTSTSSAAELAARLSAYKVPRRFLLLADDDGPDAVERQARPARARRRCSVPADAVDDSPR